MTVFLTTALLALQVTGTQVGSGPRPDDPRLINPNGRVTPTVQAVAASTAPVLDGILDEEVWTSAPPVTGFRRDVPSDGLDAAERTEVRVVYTDEALYIGARMYQRDPSRISRLRGRRDSFMLQNDQFLVMLDSHHDHRSAFIFGVTPAGGRNDILAPNDGRDGIDPSWDPVWAVATTVDSLGWVAEIRIPFSQLRFSADPEPIWGIQFRRDILAASEAVDWSWASQAEPGMASKFGHLVGLRDIPQPGRLEVLPYAVGRSRLTEGADPRSPFDDGSVFGGSAGVDLKYGLTSSLTLDATINPDFGQVEADPAVVNLSTFETFFEERRPFFVEGSGIFDFGNARSSRFFYSRRVGHAPSLPASATYVDRPDASTILGAAKLSGKTDSGWAIGVMGASTAQEFAQVAESPTGPTTRVPVEPAANYGVVRMRRDLRDGQTQIGMIGTGVWRGLDRPEYDLLHDRALTTGLDFRHRFFDLNYSLTGMFGVSHISGSAEAMARTQQSSVHFYQQPEKDYVDRSAGATSMTGTAGKLSFAKDGGSWVYGVDAAFITPGFEMNDAGFQIVSDYRALTLIGERRWLEPTRYFRRFSVGGNARSQWDFGSHLVDREIEGSIGGQLHSFQRVRVTGGYKPETFDVRATRGGPFILRPSEWRGNFDFNGDGRNALTGGLNVGFGRSSAGSRSFQVRPSLRGRGQGWVTWSISPRYSQSSDDAFYVAQRNDPSADPTFGRRYLFSTLDQKSLDVSVRLDMALTPALTLQLWAQPFIATGNYEAFKSLTRPQSYDFLELGTGGSTLAFDDETGSYTADVDGTGPADPLSFNNPDFRVRSLRGNLVLRWEYIPGSTLFLVWSQDRSDFGSDPSFGGFSGLTDVFLAPQRNVFLVKMNYWLDF